MMMDSPAIVQIKKSPGSGTWLWCPANIQDLRKMRCTSFSKISGER
jgi:hypothetical protein